MIKKKRLWAFIFACVLLFSQIAVADTAIASQTDDESGEYLETISKQMQFHLEMLENDISESLTLQALQVEEKVEANIENYMTMVQYPHGILESLNTFELQIQDEDGTIVLPESCMKLTVSDMELAEAKSQETEDVFVRVFRIILNEEGVVQEFCDITKEDQKLDWAFTESEQLKEVSFEIEEPTIFAVGVYREESLATDEMDTDADKVLSTTVGEKEITLGAPTGSLPNGAVLKAEDVTEKIQTQIDEEEGFPLQEELKEKSAKDFCAYNIYIMTEDEEQITEVPGATVTITDTAASEEALVQNVITVYQVVQDDDGNIEDCVDLMENGQVLSASMDEEKTLKELSVQTDNLAVFAASINTTAASIAPMNAVNPGGAGIVSPVTVDKDRFAPMNNLLILDNMQGGKVESLTTDGEKAGKRISEIASISGSGVETADKALSAGRWGGDSYPSVSGNLYSSLKSGNEMGALGVLFQPSDPASASSVEYAWNYAVGWPETTNDETIDTTPRGIDVKYTNVGYYKGRLINAKAEIRITPSKNRNWQTEWGKYQGNEVGYGNAEFYPMMQISDSLYRGWVWQNVEQFKIDLTFYYSDDATLTTPIVLGTDNASYDDLVADYYTINSLNPPYSTGRQGEDPARNIGPEYVLPKHGIANAYVVGSYGAGYTSNIRTRYDVADQTTQYAYHGTGEGGTAAEWGWGGEDVPTHNQWAQNSVMIMPKKEDGKISLLLGKMEITKKDTSGTVQATEIMWASISTTPFTKERTPIEIDVKKEFSGIDQNELDAIEYITFDLMLHGTRGGVSSDTNLFRDPGITDLPRGEAGANHPNWYLYHNEDAGYWAGTDATVNRTGNGLQVNYTATGSSEWGIQLFQNVTLKKGIKYEVSFKAKPTGSKKILVKFDKREDLLDTGPIQLNANQQYDFNRSFTVGDQNTAVTFLIALGGFDGDTSSQELEIWDLKLRALDDTEEEAEDDYIIQEDMKVYNNGGKFEGTFNAVSSLQDYINEGTFKSAYYYIKEKNIKRKDSQEESVSNDYTFNTVVWGKNPDKLVSNDGHMETTTITGQSSVPQINKINEYFKVTNTKKTGSITIQKNGIDDVGLGDVQFKLQETDDSWQPISGENSRSGTTSSGGKLTFTDLPLGHYLLTEIKTASGYQLLKEPIEITLPYVSDTELPTEEDGVEQDGKWYYCHLTYTISNDQSFHLPMTGTAGMGMFPFVGTIILITSGGFLLMKRKRLFS